MKKKDLVRIFILVLGALSGCAPKPIASPPSYMKVLESLSTRTTSLSTFYAEGKITVETPSYAHTGAITVYLKRPDTLYLLIQGPFGLKIGAGLFTRSSFTFYNSIQNKLITGVPSEENIERILNVPLTFDDLLNVFVGGSLVQDDQRPPDDIQTDPEWFIFTYANSHGMRKYWIDPSTTTLSRVHIYDSWNNLLLEQTYKNFHEIQSLKVPYSIQLVYVPNNQRIALSYSSVSTQTLLSKQLQVTYPDNAEHIRW